MPVGLPYKEDVRLGRPPLAEVICQVRFDPILIIPQEDPAQFQEHIRRRFPRYEKQQLFTVPIIPFSDVQQPPEFQLGSRSYRFENPSDGSAITLASDFVALSTESHSVWPDFGSDLELIARAMNSTYSPVSVVRTGLRYINKFSPPKVGVGDLDALLDLFNTEFIAPLRAHPSPKPRVFATHLELDAGDGDTLAIRFVVNPEDQEAPVILDLDFYREGPLSIENLVKECDGFHQDVYAAFRYVVRDDALKYFEPLR